MRVRVEAIITEDRPMLEPFDEERRAVELHYNRIDPRKSLASLTSQRQANVNKELFMGSIRMLANAIDEKDPYTRGHSERVAFYSMLMARHLGMSDDEVEKVHLSGIIHAEIIHGKGTWALRAAVQSYLKTHPHVKSFRLGTFGEGEDGVTIVEMK